MCDSHLIVKNLVVYEDNSRGVYRGINKNYFPKWEGWALIESCVDKETVDLAVYNFYMAYFYYQMKLDLFSNQAIACAMLNFSTLHGKKKAIQKLQHTTGTSLEGVELIEAFNSLGKCGEYHLLLEFTEFYSFTGTIESIDWVTRAYRCL